MSVIVPCRDEERYIGPCLDSIIASDYPQERLEVLVADGRSRDGTRDIVTRYATQHVMIRLLDNPAQITPTGLNAGLRAARGDVIMRMDAHVVYPPSYIPRLVAALLESGADNVGGIIATLPADSTPVARAIAAALSHPFGVGTSYFRIGVGKRRWVDNVAFGCWRRETFSRIGLFDEAMIRNQDDEFNFRLLRAGGRVVLVPGIVSHYYARASLRQLARMYFQYGYFKPLVAAKIGKVMTVRQLVPGLFTLTLLVLGLLAPWWEPGRVIAAAVLGVYLVGDLGSSLALAPRQGVGVALAAFATFPVLHLSYGLGFLRGTAALLLRRGRPPADPGSTPLSR